MGSTWRYISGAMIFAYFVACAPVQFNGDKADDTGTTSQDICPRVCDASGNSCVLRCEVNRTAGTGLVDILIVNDNSGSMSSEQRRMGSRFPDFLNSIGSLDYQIAMTTTDVSASPGNGPNYINQYGKLQDGNLIEFSPGLTVLKNTTAGKESLFNNAIQRQETLNCETSGFRVCPSSDERGIFAANLFLDRTAGALFRPTAHFAMIILSDEDERGLSNSNAINRRQGTMMPLEAYDKPKTFVDKMKTNYPQKTFSVHSLIVRPGDSNCLNAQLSNYDPNIWGYEGFSYKQLSDMTGGTVGTICSDDYGAQLGAISNSIRMQISALPFQCRPIGDQYSVTFTPQPAGTIRTSADFATMQLVVSDPVPPGTKINLTYECAIPN